MKITSDLNESDTVELIEYNDTQGGIGIELKFDFKSQKDFISFYLSQADAKELAKKIIDMT